MSYFYIKKTDDCFTLYRITRDYYQERGGYSWKVFDWSPSYYTIKQMVKESFPTYHPIPKSETPESILEKLNAE